MENATVQLRGMIAVIMTPIIPVILFHDSVDFKVHRASDRYFSDLKQTSH